MLELCRFFGNAARWAGDLLTVRLLGPWDLGTLGPQAEQWNYSGHLWTSLDFRILLFAWVVEMKAL